MNRREPLVYVLVLTCAGRQFLEPCFQTLSETCHGKVRLLLVDDCSSDGSHAFVRERFPEVEILRLDENVGYTRAANAGIRYAADRDADYVVVCNDDIELIDDHWLTQAVATADSDPRIGIVGFQEEATRDVDIPTTIDVEDAKSVVAFAFFVRVLLLKILGLFDEDYLQFETEMDLVIGG